MGVIPGIKEFVSEFLSEKAMSADGYLAERGLITLKPSEVAPVNAMQTKGIDPGPTGVEKVVYFDFDSFVIKAEAKSIIEAHARYLRADTKRRANLEGHTDERGGSEYNLALGQKRADAVRQSLSLLGVGDSQIESVSFGKEKPAVQGSDESAYAKNRRVEFFYK